MLSDSPPAIYWDACVLLSYFNAEPGRVEVVGNLLAEAKAKRCTLFTSALTITEAAFGTNLDEAALAADEEQALQQFWQSAPVEVADVHPAIAFAARSLMRVCQLQQVRLRPMDALHLATAQELHVGSSIHTTANCSISTVSCLSGSANPIAAFCRSKSDPC